MASPCFYDKFALMFSFRLLINLKYFDQGIVMPQVETEEKWLFGQFFVTNLVYYETGSYLTNPELLKVCHPAFERQTMSYAQP